MSKAHSKKQQPLVRMDAADKVVLEDLAAQTGISAPRILHRAIVRFKKEMFFERMNRGYQNLKEHPELWKETLNERRLFDSAANDGLEELK